MRKNQLTKEAEFVKGAHLSFRNMHKINLSDNNIEFINIVSSEIFYSHFINVSFHNASFLSSKFSEVDFNYCNITCADICSIWAKQCKFLQCDFSNSTITDCTFINCTFDNSIFEDVTMARCQFIECTFLKFPIGNSTFTLNEFLNCMITNTEFTPSFFFQIFDNCKFYKVNMSPELLGYNFGFSKSTFKKLSSNINLNELYDSFKKKGLFINAAILRINEIHDNYDAALFACVAALCEMMRNDILIKADEVEFLQNVVQFLHKKNSVTPYSLLKIWQLLESNLACNLANVSIDKAMPHIRRLTNTLYFDYIDFEVQLQKKINQLPIYTNTFDKLELKIIYAKKPQYLLSNFLISFAHLAGPNCPMPYLIRTEKGSYIEFHEIAVVVMPYLQTFFGLLGVITPIVIYKLQKRDNNSKIPENSVTEKVEIQINMIPEKTQKPQIILPTNEVNATTNNLIYGVANSISSTSPIKLDNYCGYTSQNIKSITITII